MGVDVGGDADQRLDVEIAILVGEAVEQVLKVGPDELWQRDEQRRLARGKIGQPVHSSSSTSSQTSASSRTASRASIANVRARQLLEGRAALLAAAASRLSQKCATAACLSATGRARPPRLVATPLAV